MRIFVVVMLLGHGVHAFAAFERIASGARGAAMGGSLVALAGNEWCAFVNPAALRTIEQRTLSLFYAPQPFEMKELAFGAAAYVEPTSIGSFGLAATRWGFELYNETRLALSFAEEFVSGFYAGVNISYNALSIRNYGSASTLGVDVGLLMDVSESVRWGFGALNINAPTIGAAKEKLPQVFSTGVAFTPMPGASITASVMKDVRYPVELRIGLEYTLIEVLALRAGSTSDPNTLNAGLGVRVGFADFDYAFSSHSALGMTHQFSISLRLGAW